MATQVAIVRTVAQVAGGQQDITSADITDFSAAICFVFGATSDGSAATHARMGVGFCVEDQEGSSGTAKSTCYAGNSRSGVATTAANRTRMAASASGTSGRFIMVTSESAPNTTVVAAADAIDRTTSGLANGVRLNWTTTPDQAYELVFILFGGLTAQDIKPTSATTITWNFRADAMFTIAGGNAATGNGAALNGSQFDFGVCVNKASFPQGAWAGRWEFNATTTDGDAIVYSAKSSGSVANNGTYTTGMVTTGISSTQTTHTDPEGQTLAMQFGDTPNWGYALESIPAGTGVANFTGLGFAPKIAFGLSTLLQAADTQTDGATAAGVGMFAFDTQAGTAFAGCVRAEEGVVLGTTAASTLFNTRACLLMDETGAVSSEAISPAAISGGFSLNFTSAGNGRMLVFGFGPATALLVTQETVSIADAQVLLLASKLVTSETVLISDSEVMMEQVGVALEDSPRGLCVQGGPIKGTTAIGGAERGESLSSS